ncbi:hypothetical protein KOW79_003657 [Hemibagrus wyckioides]|uniref:Uncharacterized protein n=1 Tax=Hemibagrus wyckioides TaxID=337641 RepID=A0A9D3P339_9TELE|nr:hypothetical protein KOW79_003657 [Hemibagrus wyckioides]
MSGEPAPNPPPLLSRINPPGPGFMLHLCTLISLIRASVLSPLGLLAMEHSGMRAQEASKVQLHSRTRLRPPSGSEGSLGRLIWQDDRVS